MYMYIYMCLYFYVFLKMIELSLQINDFLHIVAKKKQNDMWYVT